MILPVMGWSDFLRGKPDRKSSNGKLAMLLNRHAIDLVVDVGANIGQTHDKLRSIGYRDRIASIEPLSDAHAMISQKAKSDPLWSILPRMALGSRSGTATMFSAQASDMSSIYKPNDGLITALPKSRTIGMEAVPIERLDALWSCIALGAKRPLLKLDTQGSELAILDGAAGCISSIEAVLIELSLSPLYEGESDYLTVGKRLSDLGFHPVLFIPGYFSRSQARLLQMDGLFVRAP